MRHGKLFKLDILGVERSSSGELRIKVGDIATGEGKNQDCAVWGMDGFISRPNNPTATAACQALIQEDGSARRIVGTKDNRFISAYGQLESGDRAIVSTSKARLLYKNATASIVSYTETPNGDVCIVSLEGSSGTLTVSLGGPDGTAMIQAKSGSIMLASGGGAGITLKGKNVTITGDICWIATGRQVIGQIGGLPPPPGLTSALVGPSGMLGAPSSQCTIAP